MTHTGPGPQQPHEPQYQPPHEPPYAPQHVNPYADPLIDHREWQRLDPLMLVVHPVRELIRFLPALLGLLVAGNRTGASDLWWQVGGIVIPIGLGVARYMTTSFRIAEGRIELRRGLLNKHVLSTQVDRVRTVDVTASPIHRVLGLTTVRIGTGTASTSNDDEIDLDGLRNHAAQALRSELLHRTAAAREPAPAHAWEPDNARVVLSFDPRWLRFAPLTTSGLIIAAATLGVGNQILDALGLWDHLRLDRAAEQVGRLSLVLLVPVLVIGLVVIASVMAVAGYLVSYFGFTLTRTRSDDAWHVRRGLFTTRETSIDNSRLHGVTIGEPLGLRLARGARMSAVVTGLDRKQEGSSSLVPPAPRATVDRVAAEVLGTPEPLAGPLVPHGPAAARRRWTRALLVPAVLVAALVVGVLMADVPAAWLLLGVAALAAGAALARDRSRALGHALTAGHLVSRSGSLARRRVALDTDAVIGWNFSASWFQRRAGLATLVATMAGGKQSVTVLDIPEEVAVAVARDGVPGLVEQFQVDAPGA